MGLRTFLSCGAADLFGRLLGYQKSAVRILTVFQHCVRALLQYTSTSMCAFLKDSALLVCIPTVFQHRVRAFPLSILLSLGCIVRVYFYYVLAVYNV